MDLLEPPPLPVVLLRGSGAFGEVFDEFTRIAGEMSLDVHRLDKSDHDCDRLDICFQAKPAVKFCLIASAPSRIECEVVDESGGGHSYDEYVSRLKELFKPLSNGYLRATGHRLRLGIPGRPQQWDRAELDCSHVDYYEGKFCLAVRDLATGPGDVRERLRGAAPSLLFVVQSRNLPEPLRAHWEWSQSQLTRRPARHKHEGTLDSTLAKMKNATGAKIAERIVDVAAALHQLKSRRPDH